MIEDLSLSKKKINEDWLNSFPELTKYTQNKFYKIIGPMIIGIELIKLPRIQAYRPHFVCYPLWKESVKLCFDSPILIKEFENNKGMQFSIPYLKHDSYFFNVLQGVRNQSPILSYQTITLKDIFFEIDKHSKIPPLSASPNSYLQAELQKTKLKIALYLGHDKQIKEILNHIEKRDWKLQHFTLWNVKYADWIYDIKEGIKNRNTFINLIEINKQDNKLKKLQQLELK